jgi:hypothetical protein
MLDSDLAELYQVPTKAFNPAVKRNLGRFPSDFMFRFSAEEMELLDRSQFVRMGDVPTRFPISAMPLVHLEFFRKNIAV